MITTHRNSLHWLISIQKSMEFTEINMIHNQYTLKTNVQHYYSTDFYITLYPVEAIWHNCHCSLLSKTHKSTENSFAYNTFFLKVICLLFPHILVLKLYSYQQFFFCLENSVKRCKSTLYDSLLTHTVRLLKSIKSNKLYKILHSLQKNSTSHLPDTYQIQDITLIEPYILIIEELEILPFKLYIKSNDVHIKIPCIISLL